MNRQYGVNYPRLLCVYFNEPLAPQAKRAMHVTCQSGFDLSKLFKIFRGNALNCIVMRWFQNTIEIQFAFTFYLN